VTLPIEKTDSVVRRRTALVDDKYGDPTPTGTTTDVTYDCHAQQVNSAKSRDDPGRKSKRTGWHFWFEPDVDILATDTLVFRGVVLEINGDPNHWNALGFAYVELEAFAQRG
jgi:hypothetical protein